MSRKKKRKVSPQSAVNGGRLALRLFSVNLVIGRMNRKFDLAVLGLAMVSWGLLWKVVPKVVRFFYMIHSAFEIEIMLDWDPKDKQGPN
ncbi:hypothetical protein K1719_023341 [Acacia pycnantha]|nr:hypothetical protein K1719_023341 [Acacia pycnantha]